MSPDVDTSIAHLREKFSDLEGTVRVVKHEQANMRMVLEGITAKLDRHSEKVDTKIDGLATTINSLNVKQAVTTSQIGMSAGIILVCVSIVMGLAKVLFG